MGLLRSESSGRSWARRRGGAILSIAGLHVAAVAGLYHAGVIRPDPKPDVQAIKVAFLATPKQEPPRPEQPLIEPPPPVSIPVLRIDIPIDMPVPRTAITATPTPPAPPPPSPMPVAAVADDIPVLVDTVDYLYQEPPRYPPQAKRARAQGVVYLRVVIDREGLPRDVSVHRSSGHRLLDGAACDAVQKFRFRPYRSNGVPHSAQVIVPVEFSLKTHRS